MDLTQTIFFLFGMFFLVCAFAHSMKSAAPKVKKMKLDPDWINFIIGSALVAIGLSFVLLLMYDVVSNLNGSF